MTSLDEFLAKKRQERTRGKLAGLDKLIQELRDIGASYNEIAEYLWAEHGVKVTRSGLQKHLKSLADNHSVQRAIESRMPAHRQAAEQSPQPHQPPPATPENAPASGEVFKDPVTDDGDRIQARDEMPGDDVVTRYRLSSPEHQAMLAAYRRSKENPET